MKLTEKYIKKYLADFHYGLTREQLEQDWVLDDKPYYKEKDCFCFHAADKCWLEVGRTEIAEAFQDWEYSEIKRLSNSFLDVAHAAFEPLTKTLEEIGRDDFKESGFYAGVEHEKKVAIEAFQKVIDKFYDSNFDPTIDYMKIFKENL